MSLYAGEFGLRVICHDLARRCAVVGEAVIAKRAVRVSQADVAAIRRKARETQAVSAVASQLDGKNRRGRALAEIARSNVATRGRSRR